MDDQRHRIRRQIFEVAVPGADREEAWRLQSDLAQLQHRWVAGILDRILSDFCPPDRVIRLGTVEVDLGEIRVDRIEQDLVEKLGPALRAVLTEQLRKEEARTPARRVDRHTGSQLELLVFFARTGTLPWWADASAPRVLDESLGFLLQRAAGPLSSVMPTLARDRGKLLRIVLHCTNESLSALLGVLLAVSRPELAVVPSERAALLRALLRAGGVLPEKTSAAFRASMWLGTLRAACEKNSAPDRSASSSGSTNTEGHTQGFWRDAMAQIALDAGLTYTALIRHLAKTTDHPPLSSLARALLRELRGELVRSDPQSPQGVSSLDTRFDVQPVPMLHRGIREDAQERLRGVMRSPDSEFSQRDSAAPDPVQAPSQTLSDPPRPSADASAFTQAEGGPDGPRSVQESDGNPALTPHSRLLEEEHEVPIESWQEETEHRLREQTLAERRSSVERGLYLAAPSGPSHSLGLDPELPIDLAYADTEGVYVENAGLVILWPFLGRLFERLDLVRSQDGGEKGFRDRASLHRAVGLLQHTVTGETEPQEYQVPLAKVLCGMDPAEVFAFGEPVTATESQECDLFLNAAIVNAPILGEMSVDGFRGAFLIRKGLLSARDGTWSLRVERLTHDILLEQLPWQLSWIKLPWLEAPLCVEW